MQAYSYSDVSRLSGAAPSSVKWWTHQNVLRADIAESAGTGHHRRFSFLNLVEAAVAAEMNRYAVSLEAIRPVLRLLRFLAVNGRIDQPIAAQIQVNPWRMADTFAEYFRQSAIVNSPKVLSQAKAHGIDSTEALIEWLTLWRAIVSPQFRQEFAFAAIGYSAEQETSAFVVQPRRGEIISWEHLGRSVLFIDLLPILNELEAATGDQLP